MEPKAYKCDSCGFAIFPKHARCPKCKGRRFSEVGLREGRVVTYTVLHATPPGIPKPLQLAIAEFEHGVRLIAQVSRGNAEIGKRVTLVESKLRETPKGVLTGFSFAASD